MNLRRLDGKAEPYRTVRRQSRWCHGSDKFPCEDCDQVFVIAPCATIIRGCSLRFAFIRIIS